MKNILIIHTQSSLNDLSGKEALDLSLIFGAYEQQVSVLFLNQGVLQTLAHQDPEAIHQKDYLSTIKALEIYDIEDVFVCSASLAAFNIENNELLPNIQLADSDSINSLKSQADHIYVV